MTFSPGTKPAKTAPKGRHLDINILTSLPCPNPRLRACLLPNPTESQRAQQPWSGMPRAQPRGREQGGEGGDRAGRACQYRAPVGHPLPCRQNVLSLGRPGVCLGPELGTRSDNAVWEPQTGPCGKNVGTWPHRGMQMDGGRSRTASQNSSGKSLGPAVPKPDA